jgi:phage FluMu gp28-like protein
LTSFNLEDAYEKIRYINLMDEGIPAGDRMRREVDCKTSIEFENGNRIVTMFLPRGKGPAEVVIDEMAIMKDPRGVYQAAQGMTARGGNIIVGSSPLAQAGQFADIWKGEGGKFRRFRRLAVPFWKSAALCKDIPAATAAYERGERIEAIVYTYARPAIIEAFESMFTEDFLTEFCCKWMDSSSSFLSWELIDSCCPPEHVVRRASMSGLTGLEGVLSEIENLHDLEGELFSGFDVGRRRDKSEVVIGELIDGVWREVLALTLDRVEFEVQEKITNALLENERARVVVIDETGLGMELAERGVKRHGSRVQGVTMSVKTKPQLANNLRIAMEGRKAIFGRDRETMIQLHSVKRKVRPGSNTVTYDVDRNEKHHADKFVALSLALWGASEKMQARRPQLYVFDFSTEARPTSAIERLEQELIAN